MNDTEHWLPIPGYEGIYDVSDQGRVRSWLPYHGTPTPRIKKTNPNHKGYLLVGLRNEGRDGTAAVHKLVMLAFVGTRPVGMEIRHLDGNCQNNVTSNLGYGTPSENNLDAVRHGTHRNARKTHCMHGHAFDAVNTYVTTQGGRRCRACRSVRRFARLARTA